MRIEDVKLYQSAAEIPAPQWDELVARGPSAAAVGAGVEHKPGQGYIVPFLGADYVVNPDTRAITGPAGHLPVGFQKGLVLVTYLARAQDLGLSGRMVTARDLNGGALFFTASHALAQEPATTKFARNPEGFIKKAQSLGLDRLNEPGVGYACRGLVLPHLAVGCVFHEEDDEFPAEITYTFDSYAHYHLPLDGIWALVNVLADELAA